MIFRQVLLTGQVAFAEAVKKAAAGIEAGVPMDSWCFPVAFVVSLENTFHSYV